MIHKWCEYMVWCVFPLTLSPLTCTTLIDHQGNALWEYDGWGPDWNGGIYHEGGHDTTWGRAFGFWKREVGTLQEGRKELLALCSPPPPPVSPGCHHSITAPYELHANGDSVTAGPRHDRGGLSCLAEGLQL